MTGGLGSDEETLDEFSKVLKRITEELESERFQFKPTRLRREYIPKANGRLMRPRHNNFVGRGIPSPRDKIVQKAMAILLELIYEQEFLDVSHGFRPKRGCHTAIKQINQWKGMKWGIEGHIKGFFDNVDQPLLVKLLEKKIKDQQFIDLIHKLIKAGYVEGGLKRDSLLGYSVPQGGIISPILSNIVLHELDRYITDLIEAKSSKKKSISTRNPKYDKPSRRILRDKYNDVKSTYRPLEIQEEIPNLIKEINCIPSTLSDGNRIKYIRYADD